ncbi:glutaredoxin family protein [uncultured Pseudoteredinibacter sp.]|uniref:glutaredoxin family protein n=1 Tax=uncultured Pseudoteredinibacter sp. TaxID=1641701 RepID=UPI00262FCA35|nr:glutaredoxin family protein [uncultured Pseudoteredinibacter sp.]
MNSTVTLYTTAGCHLCEQAKTLFWPCAQSLALRLEEVDIAHSAQLVERYGIRIPVIATKEGREIAWPFDQQQLFDFLQNA